MFYKDTKIKAVAYTFEQSLMWGDAWEYQMRIKENSLYIYS